MNDADRKAMDKASILVIVEEALILVYDNLQTSGSKLGLKKRGNNLRKIEEMLRELVGLTEDDLDIMYWERIEREGR